MKDSQTTVSDGRTIAYTDIGEPGWPCVMFFHGAPSSRLRLSYLEPEFLASGIRVVAPDRPGYGRSSPQPGRSMADWPRDVATLADALQIDRFVPAGHSSGGPYALACAAMLSKRVSGAILLGGVTNMAWPGAWEDYPATESLLMRLHDEEVVRVSCEGMFGADGSRFLAASDLQFPEPDVQLYTDERIVPLLNAARAEAFHQGVTGYAQDIAVQGRPWPFDPGTIDAPVLVAHGELDTLVPLAHSRHSAALIPGSALRVLPGHGHFTILGELPALAATLFRSLT